MEMVPGLGAGAPLACCAVPMWLRGGRKLLIRHQRDHDDERADQRPIQLAGSRARNGAISRRKLVYPGKKERHWKADKEEN